MAEVREYEDRLRKIFEQSQDRLGYWFELSAASPGLCGPGTCDTLLRAGQTLLPLHDVRRESSNPWEILQGYPRTERSGSLITR